MHNKFIISVLMTLISFVFAVENHEFNVLQPIVQDLNSLRQKYPGSQALDELWELAVDVAKMNDRCATISLSEALDAQCTHFYEVELPKFEQNYQKVTGELRMSSIAVQSDIDDQIAQIRACVDALETFYASEAQVKEFKVKSFKIKPLNFEGTEHKVEYDFEIERNSNIEDVFRDILKTWRKKCDSVFLENPELFSKGIDNLNKKMALRGVSAFASVREYGGCFVLGFGRTYNAGGEYKLGDSVICNTAGSDVKDYDFSVYFQFGYGSYTPWFSSIRTVHCKGSVNMNAGQNLRGRWIWKQELIPCGMAFKRDSQDYRTCVENSLSN